ncbi:MAG: hypothetical protein JWR72_1499 [Flavisolibacter sp.]|nr:hypothetical protein [Flavisolibacter sp.]
MNLLQTKIVFGNLPFKILLQIRQGSVNTNLNRQGLMLTIKSFS